MASSIMGARPEAHLTLGWSCFKYPAMFFPRLNAWLKSPRYEQVKLGETGVLAVFWLEPCFRPLQVLLPAESFVVAELIRAAAMAMRDGPLAGMESIDAKGRFQIRGRGGKTPLELLLANLND
jgi:hypothetical protein